MLENFQYSFDFSKAFEKIQDYGDFLEALSHDIDSCGLRKKDIAAELDMSPSEFSRKYTNTFLSNPNDSISPFSIKDLEKLYSIIGRRDSIVWLFRKFVMEREEEGYQHYLRLADQIPNLDKVLRIMNDRGGLAKLLEIVINKE